MGPDLHRLLFHPGDHGFQCFDQSAFRDVAAEPLRLFGLGRDALEDVPDVARMIVRMIRPFHAAEDGPLHDVRIAAHDGHAPVRAEASAPEDDLVVAQRLSEIVHIRRRFQDVESLQVEPLFFPERFLGPAHFLQGGRPLLRRHRAVERKLDGRFNERVRLGRSDAALSHHDHVPDLQVRPPAAFERAPALQPFREPAESGTAVEKKDGRALLLRLGSEPIVLHEHDLAFRVGSVEGNENHPSFGGEEASVPQQDALRVRISRSGRGAVLGGRQAGQGDGGEQGREEGGLPHGFLRIGSGHFMGIRRVSE